jgi:hypothetical protein
MTALPETSGSPVAPTLAMPARSQDEFASDTALFRMPINPQRLTGALLSPLPRVCSLGCKEAANRNNRERHHRSNNAPPSKRAVKCHYTDPSLGIANTTILLPPTN